MPERRTWRSEGKGRGEWKEENESAIGVFCISGLLLHWLLCLDSNLFLLRKARDLQSVFPFFFSSCMQRDTQYIEARCLKAVFIHIKSPSKKHT